MMAPTESEDRGPTVPRGVLAVLSSKWTRRRWMVVGGLAAPVTLGAIAWTWRRADPWPARLVIKPTGDGWSWNFSPDGRWFRAVGRDGLTAYDATTGRPGATIPLPDPVRGLVIGRAFSGDGRRFVGWNGGDAVGIVVAAGDAGTGAIERRPSTGRPSGLDLEFRPDGRTVEAMLPIGGYRMMVITWDTTTGAAARRTVLGPGGGFTNLVAYTPDGRTWAYVARLGGGIQLWDSVTDRPIGGQLRPPTPLSPATAGR